MEMSLILHSVFVVFVVSFGAKLAVDVLFEVFIARFSLLEVFVVVPCSVSKFVLCPN